MLTELSTGHSTIIASAAQLTTYRRFDDRRRNRRNASHKATATIASCQSDCIKAKAIEGVMAFMAFTADWLLARVDEPNFHAKGHIDSDTLDARRFPSLLADDRERRRRDLLAWRRHDAQRDRQAIAADLSIDD